MSRKLWLIIVQDLISSYNAMGCNMSFQFHFMHFNLDFFMKTWEPSPINMAKISIRTFPTWEIGTVENGVQICWLTTAGVKLVGRQVANTRRSECLMKKFFVVKIPYPDTLFIILTLRIVIKNQYSLFYYECGFLIPSLLLNTGGRRGNLVFIFGLSNVNTIRIALNFNRK